MINSPFHEAIDRNNIEAVEDLITSGTKITTYDLRHAARHNFIGIVQVLARGEAEQKLKYVEDPFRIIESKLSLVDIYAEAIKITEAEGGDTTFAGFIRLYRLRIEELLHFVDDLSQKNKDYETEVKTLRGCKLSDKTLAALKKEKTYIQRFLCSDFASRYSFSHGEADIMWNALKEVIDRQEGKHVQETD